DVVHLEGGLCDGPGHDTVGAHVGVVADAAQQPVGDTRRAAGTTGDLRGGVVAQIDPEDRRGTVQDPLQFGRLVEVHVRGETEPVAERAGEGAGTRGRADEGEG